MMAGLPTEVLVALVTGLCAVFVAVISGALVRGRNKAETRKVEIESTGEYVTYLCKIIESLRAELVDREADAEKLAAATAKEMDTLRAELTTATEKAQRFERLLVYLLKAPAGQETKRIAEIRQQVRQAQEKKDVVE